MPAERPNILVYMTDHQRADTIHPDHPCRTPNVQRVIDSGVLFTEHLSVLKRTLIFRKLNKAQRARSRASA